MKNITICLFLLCHACFGAVRGTNDNISFDVQMDGQPEMTLNSTGLGLGVIPSTNLHINGNAIISAQLFVGGNSGSSNFNVNGTMGFGAQTVNASTILGNSSVVLVDSSSNTILVTLPYAGSVSGRIYTIKKTSLANEVLLSGGGNLIDSSSLFNLSSGNIGAIKVISNGTSWSIMDKSDSVMDSSYMIVDVSGGPAATSYPVSYTNATPDLTGAGNLEFKTSKIVLKWIEPGRFTMGNTTVGATPEHPVVLTQGFWAGVFEVTRKQWLNVMSNNPTTPGYTNSANTLPMESVSWDDIRGLSATYDWPTITTVGPNTFMGNLLAKTGLPFDLPTEAEWEYACRAGTITIWSYGSATGTNYEWTVTNSGGTTHEVGGKLPNPWGLYDIHGNVCEWCRDWNESPYPSSSEQNDPSGPNSGSSRVRRGGHFVTSSTYSRSAQRQDYQPSFRGNFFGFRLFSRPN
jgi:formylglycine-generating enzyme required for sulfatase activity